MEIAEQLSPEQRSKAKSDAIKSACYGSLPAVMIQDSAIIILFASVLGAGNMLSMTTTAIQGISNCLLVIPFAYLSGRFGHKKTIMLSTFIGMLTIMLLASSPYFENLTKMVLLVSISLFSIAMVAYSAAWFPFLNAFLIRKERGSFFGLMRFSWQTVSLIFFLLCGLMIGKNPETWMLQVIIAICGLSMLGRIYYISRIPDEHQIKEKILFAESISEAISNKSLVGFSVYICCLYMAAYSTLPLTFIYLKKYLLVADNMVVIISSLTLVGTIVGFLMAGKIMSVLGTKQMLLLIHFSFATVNIALFMINSSSIFMLVLMTVLLALYGFFTACSSIAISTEMMELASPNNQAISMAFCITCYAGGTGGSRLLTSLILGSGMLSNEWFIGSMRISYYQTLFLLYGVAILFVCLLLVLVPAIFPKGNYRYDIH
jgi:MFS family permease